MGEVFHRRIFCDIAPLAQICQGPIMVINGIWMKPWLMNLNGLSRHIAAQLLFVMTLVFIGGFLTLGIIDKRLSQLFDIRPNSISVFGMTLFLFIQAMMIAGSFR